MLMQLSMRSATASQDLVDLLGECHQRIRRFVALAREAASRRDAPPDQVAQACAAVERYFVEALPLHVADEEESLEPRLRGLSPSVDQALATVAHQHQQHVSKIAALLAAIGKVRSQPYDEWARGELTTAAIALETELEEHLRLEESAIFPAIRELLSREIQTSIIDELRKRRQSGWSQTGPAPLASFPFGPGT